MISDGTRIWYRQSKGCHGILQALTIRRTSFLNTDQMINLHICQFQKIQCPYQGEFGLPKPMLKNMDTPVAVEDARQHDQEDPIRDILRGLSQQTY